MKFYHIPVGLIFSVCSLFPAAYEHNPLQAVYTVDPVAFDAQAMASIEKSIGYTFNKKSRLEKAFTTEKKNPNKNLEVYEYKGDAVLKLAQGELIHRKFPQATPHERTQVKCAIESTEPLCALAVRLGLHQYVQHSIQRIKADEIEDVVEALIWALYKDGGQDVAEKFITRFFYPMIKDHAIVPGLPHELIVEAQRKNVPAPQFQKNIASPRAVKYNTAVQFVREHLPAEYQQRLITWPLDSNYAPFDESLKLDLDWVSCSENARTRLHNLYAMIGVAKPVYHDEQLPDGMFVSRLNGAVVSEGNPAATKNKAQEYVAIKALEILQDKMLLPQLQHIDLNELATLYLNQAVQDLPSKSKVNNICQRFDLEMPCIDVRIRAGLVSEPLQYYAVAQAPWLPISFESAVVASRAEAEAEVCTELVKCLYTWKTRVPKASIKPGTLMLIHLIEKDLADSSKPNKELMNVLADKLGKERPSMKVLYADSSLAEYPNPLFECQLSFEDTIIRSEPKLTVQAAEEDVARVFLAKWLRDTKRDLFERM